MGGSWSCLGGSWSCLPCDDFEEELIELKEMEMRICKDRLEMQRETESRRNREMEEEMEREREISLREQATPDSARRIFHDVAGKTYLFKGVSKDFILQMSSIVKTEYIRPNVDIVWRNQHPGDFYILVSGSVDVFLYSYRKDRRKYLFTLGPSHMVGEFAAIMKDRQPFTVRSRKGCEVLRIRSSSFEHILRQNRSDGKTLLSNFIKFWKSLRPDFQREIPFLSDILRDLEAGLTELNDNQT